MESIPPSFDKEAFTCPYCQVYTDQSWKNFLNRNNTISQQYWYAQCKLCGKFSIWIQEKMVYPLTSLAPLPNSDMPDDAKTVFEEARNILGISPRASAGLLRVCIEKLTVELGESKGDLDARITNLVEKGLPKEIQKALHTVRVVGNKALHAGQIDMNDNPDIAWKLFKIVNTIVQQTITDKKQLDELYQDQVSEEQRNRIEGGTNTNS